MNTEKKIFREKVSINKENRKARSMTAQFMDNRSSTIQETRLTQNISFATKASFPFQLRAWIAAKPLFAAGSSVGGDGSSVSSDSTKGGHIITNNSRFRPSGFHPLSHHHIFIQDTNGIYNRGFGPINYMQSLVGTTPGHLFVESNDSQYGSKVDDIIPVGGVLHPIPPPIVRTEEQQDQIVMNEIVREFNNNAQYNFLNRNCQHFARTVRARVLAIV